MDYKLAADVGNSSTKAIIRLQSEGAKYKTLKQKTLISPNATIPTHTEEDLEVAVNDLTNNMIVHINSPALKRTGTFAVGEKATAVGRVKRNMNISIGEKHTNDIPVIMTLSMIACAAVQDHYKVNNELAKDIDVLVKYSTAIPAREYTPVVAREFEERIASGLHLVDIYVNGTPVTARITFEKVKVVQEGVPAVFAIIEGPENLLSRYHKKYGKEITNQHFKNRKLLLVDIGDGTTEFIYIVNGKPVNDLCDGMRFGVGHAADIAKKLFDEKVKVNISMNRQQFMQVVLDKEHHFHADAMETMQLANVEQAELILEQIQEMVLNTLSGDVDDIVVFGGGSATFKGDLYDELLEFTDSVGSRTLWIPENMAASLNAVGLDILNEKLFFKEAVAIEGK